MKPKVVSIIIISCLFLGCTSKAVRETNSTEWIGMPFPDLIFRQTLSSEDEKYLGLAETEKFAIKDIDTEVLIVEYLNIYCYSCQLQASIFNELYAAIQQDEKLKLGVRMLGIGAGNSQREVERYRQEKNVPFPVLPDPKFNTYDAIGNPGGTPFTVLIRKDERGEMMVLNYHLGLMRDYEDFLQEIRDALDLTEIQFSEGEDFSVDVGEKLKSALSEAQLTAKVKELMAAFGKVDNVDRALIPGDDMVYVGKLASAGQDQQLIATIVRRDSVCDVCHGLHFIYIFNEAGEIINFTPIAVYKYGNKDWDEKDIKKMESRILGRSIFEEFDFNPEVDAVSTATISSKLIFHSLNQAKKSIEELKKRGYK